MRCNERGMALVNVVLMLTVLLALSQILVDKVWQSTRQGVAADSREQLFWAAQAGIESARRHLAADYVGSGGWQALLTADAALSYPASPAWTEVINGQPVDIFLRDNQDDDDARHDNDLKLFVLARARSHNGGEAMIECLCGFDLASQASAASAETPLVNLSELPASSYNIMQ